MCSQGALSSLAKHRGVGSVAAMTEVFEQVIQFLNDIDSSSLLPIMFPAIAILPLFGFPVSVLLIPVGYTLAPAYGKVWATIYAMAAIGVNDTIAYWLARTFMRGPILRLLERKKIKVPEIPRDQEARVIALLRITPGTPLFVQSYLLGLANVDYWRYILISVPVQSIHVGLFIFMGEAVFEGKVGAMVTGLFLIVALGIIFRMVHSKHKAREAAKAAQPDDAPKPEAQ